MPHRHFFRRTGPHRDLHSFPTRRSSDLPARAGEVARAYIAGRQLLVRFTTALASVAVERVLDGLVMVGLMAVERSEEHTSELQSRRDLVCRLLLEKKNNRYRRGYLYLLK